MSVFIGVKAKHNGKVIEYGARAVVSPVAVSRPILSGARATLGRDGTRESAGYRFNVGDGLRMALEIGACPYGNWSGRHAVSWERYAPEFGDLNLPHSSYRHSYPLSIMINTDGKRFVDEGIEFYNYTYAKYGAEVLKQPGQCAWQVFDAKLKELLRPEYHDKAVTRVLADTLEELAGKMEGINRDAFVKTVREFNAAVRTEVPFNVAVKDGRCTVGIDPPKSNWANALDTPPFTAYR